VGGLVLTPVVRNLLIINAAIFIAAAILGKEILFAEWFGLRAFTSTFFSPLQLVTYMFMHGGWQHLIFNMMGLIFLGPLLETFWGSKRFFIFYMATGIGAGAIDSAIHSFEVRNVIIDSQTYMADPTPENYVWFLGRNYPEGLHNEAELIENFEQNPTSEAYVRGTQNMTKMIENSLSNRMSIGASGAIFALMMALAFLFPNTELMMLFLPIPIKAKYFVAFSAAMALYMALRRDPSDNVAHFAHLGGMLSAWILLMFWQRQRNSFY
jgi:membrane associated rhomboid family serine protease